MTKHYEEMTVEELLACEPKKPTKEMTLAETIDAGAYWRARYFARVARYKGEDAAKAAAEKELDTLVRSAFLPSKLKH